MHQRFPSSNFCCFWNLNTGLATTKNTKKRDLTTLFFYKTQKCCCKNETFVFKSKNVQQSYKCVLLQIPDFMRNQFPFEFVSHIFKTRNKEEKHKFRRGNCIK